MATNINDAGSGLLTGMKLAIDLTPMLPGGENGGAKLAALALIDALAELLPKTSFLLLTSDSSHAELEALENRFSNIERICVKHTSGYIPKNEIDHTQWSQKSVDYIKAAARKLLPGTLKHRLKRFLYRASGRRGSANLLRQHKVDLLFCPFTAPYYADPTVPTVSLILDLQYRFFPQFFSPEELVQREEAFQTALQKAAHLVTISQFVRDTVIEASGLPLERVTAISLGSFRSNQRPAKQTGSSEACIRYGLTPGEYLIYPANFWEHKNHDMLLTVFGMVRKDHPEHELKLICTGARGALADNFCEKVKRMGLSDWVIYPGFVSPQEYEALLNSAFALIFPSLYEGFGIPVLEAMAVGIPVLCSNITSLPEVGGDAVLYFDPRKPLSIKDAIERLINQEGLREELIARGRQRALLFQGPQRMAVEYLKVFSDVLRNYNQICDPSIQGLYEDGWTAECIEICFPPTQDEQVRSLCIQLENPSWIKKKVKIKPKLKNSSAYPEKVLKPGQSAQFDFPLPANGGTVEIFMSPTFVPQDLGIGPDVRELGLRCDRCEIIRDSSVISFLKRKDVVINEFH